MLIAVPSTLTALREWATSVANGVVIQEGVHPVRGHRMSVWLNGRPVQASQRGLAAAYPSAAPRLVVFLHGLTETETSWFHHDEPRKHRSGTDFGSRLADDLGCTALYVRYNTGRHVSDSGMDLVRLLSDLVRHWPTAVHEIVLIGHSLGGLVVRSAMYQAQFRRVPWLSRVTGVVCLGTPHAGAAVERATAWTAAMLAKLFVTAPLSWLLDRRSGAIKDLAHGYLHEHQWSTKLEALSTTDLTELTTFPRNLPQLFVYATVSRSPQSRLGRKLGDLVVDAASAGAPDYDADLKWLGGMHHMDLLHHDSVYDTILNWLRTRRRRPPPLPATSRVERTLRHRRTSEGPAR